MACVIKAPNADVGNSHACRTASILATAETHDRHERHSFGELLSATSATASLFFRPSVHLKSAIPCVWAYS